MVRMLTAFGMFFLVAGCAAIVSEGKCGNGENGADEDCFAEPDSMKISLLQSQHQVVSTPRKEQSELIQEAPLPPNEKQIKLSQSNTSTLSSDMLLVGAGEIAVHRAKVMQWHAQFINASSSGVVANELSTELKSDMKTAADVGKVRSQVAGAISNTLVVAVTCDSSKSDCAKEVGSAAYDGGVSIVATAATICAGPLAGIVVTLAATMLKGLFFPSDNSNPQQLLFDAVMDAVANLIKQNNIQQQMLTVKNQIAGIIDELEWMPSLINTASDDVKISYYLTVQHDLATGVRTAFGECYDDLSTKGCKSWQEAATVAVSFEYAQLHLEVFNSLYAIDSVGNDFRDTLVPKMKSVAIKYNCLLTESYEVFKVFRLSKIVGSASGGMVGCTVYDNYSGNFLGATRRRNDCSRRRKSWLDSAKANAKADLTSELATQIGDPINALFDASLTDKPCETSGLAGVYTS